MGSIQLLSISKWSLYISFLLFLSFFTFTRAFPTETATTEAEDANSMKFILIATILDPHVHKMLDSANYLQRKVSSGEQSDAYVSKARKRIPALFDTISAISESRHMYLSSDLSERLESYFIFFHETCTRMAQEVKRPTSKFNEILGHIDAMIKAIKILFEHAMFSNHGNVKDTLKALDQSVTYMKEKLAESISNSIKHKHKVLHLEHHLLQNNLGELGAFVESLKKVTESQLNPIIRNLKSLGRELTILGDRLYYGVQYSNARQRYMDEVNERSRIRVAESLEDDVNVHSYKSQFSSTELLNVFREFKNNVQGQALKIANFLNIPGPKFINEREKSHEPKVTFGPDQVRYFTKETEEMENDDSIKFVPVFS